MNLKTCSNMKEYKSTLDRVELKKVSTDIYRAKITSSRDSVNYIRKFYGDDMVIYESFFLLLMNRANNTIGYAKISQGGMCGTVVDKMIITKYAVDCLASSVILAHNHPSGNITASSADVRVTKEIMDCLKLFNVQVLDHIIITEDSYSSMYDEGLI